MISYEHFYLMSTLQFDASTRNGSWIELPTQLRRSNKDFVAMLVDSSLFPSCDEGMTTILDLLSVKFSNMVSCRWKAKEEHRRSRGGQVKYDSAKFYNEIQMI